MKIGEDFGLYIPVHTQFANKSFTSRRLWVWTSQAQCSTGAIGNHWAQSASITEQEWFSEQKDTWKMWQKGRERSKGRNKNSNNQGREKDLFGKI